MLTRNHIQVHSHPAHDTIVMGSALIGIGALCLLDTFGVLPIGVLCRYWPMALIVGGLMRILEG